MSLNQSDYAEALAATLRAVLPYAESRAEDMCDAVSEEGDDDHIEWMKADAAVSQAKTLLGDIEGGAA